MRFNVQFFKACLFSCKSTRVLLIRALSLDCRWSTLFMDNVPFYCFLLVLLIFQIQSLEFWYPVPTSVSTLKILFVHNLVVRSFWRDIILLIFVCLSWVLSCGKFWKHNLFPKLYTSQLFLLVLVSIFSAVEPMLA